MNVYDIAEKHRSELLRSEQSAARRMVDAYKQADAKLRSNLKLLQQKIKDYEASGKEVTRHWLVTEDRYKELIKQSQAELKQFAQNAALNIQGAQFEAIQRAQQDAHILIKSQLPASYTSAFNALPTNAVQNMVGYLGNGSPLSTLLDAIPGDVTNAISAKLIQGVVMGLNPRLIAKQIRNESGLGAVRALTISRTEVLRSYRQASLQTYRENDDVVDMWEWSASHSIRTCAACLAMDGKKFPLSKQFGSHPNCRCSPVPVTKSWAELGIDGVEDEPTQETGAEWFDRQPPSKQREMLGPGKYELYANGQITLDDLVQRHNSPEWGPSITEKPIKDL